jgi:tRNA threonylcarbamoyladenosine biosynthesis protein TsaB
MLLAIDTATRYASLALYDQEKDAIVAEEYWLSDRNHTTQLTPRIERMLATSNITVPQLTALAVALGPGSFTGLRIGLAVAKGLALPHKLPVIGVPTLEIEARPFMGSKQPVWAVAQAGRGRILTACYTQRKSGWQAIAAPTITTITGLAEQITRPVLVTGEIDEPDLQQLQHDTKAQIASAAARVRRAAYLAEIAIERLEAGAQDDPDALVPIYLSNP